MAKEKWHKVKGDKRRSDYMRTYPRSSLERAGEKLDRVKKRVKDLV